MRAKILLVLLLAYLAPIAAYAQSSLPTSGPKYCAALNQVVTDLIGLPAEAATSAPGVYQAELFMASIAVQNNMDATTKPTHAQITKAAKDSEDCYPGKQQPV